MRGVPGGADEIRAALIAFVGIVIILGVFSILVGIGGGIIRLQPTPSPTPTVTTSPTHRPTPTHSPYYRDNPNNFCPGCYPNWTPPPGDKPQ